MSRKHKDKGKIEGPFVPLLVETLKSKAWRCMSPYARLLHIALKSRYSFKLKNNGRIYLATRAAAEETGLNRKTVTRAFYELVHYGFIIMTEHGCLGVNGRGKAPHWRLTELGYMNDPPTRNFMSWDGVVFEHTKKPVVAPHHRHKKKQNPGPSDGPGRSAGRAIPLVRRTGQSAAKVVRQTGHTDAPPRSAGRAISSLTTPRLKKGGEQVSGGESGSQPVARAEQPSLVWSTPVIEELPWSPHWTRLALAFEFGWENKDGWSEGSK
jgi:hypothetical protein